MLNSVTERLTGALRRFAGDDLLLRVAQGASGTMLLWGASILLTFVIRWLLARLMGAANYGVYSYAEAWFDLLMVLPVLGFDRLILRSFAADSHAGRWGAIHGLWRFANRLNLYLSGALIAVVLLLSAAAFGRSTSDSDPILMLTLWLMMPLLPLRAYIQFAYHALLALDHVVSGQVPLLVIRPLVFIALIFGTSSWLQSSASPLVAMVVNLAATCVSLLLVVYMLRRVLPAEATRIPSEGDRRGWLRVSLPIAGAAALTLVNSRTDTIMLGLFADTRAVGIYSIAAQFGIVMLTIDMAASTALSPVFSRLYHADDREGLLRVTQFATRAMVAAGLVVLLCYVVFGQTLLGLFGAEFREAYGALLILSVGRFVMLAQGSVVALLQMTAFEGDVMQASVISAVLNLVLSWILISRYGIEGAALATTLSLIVRRWLLSRSVRNRLHINPVIFG